MKNTLETRLGVFAALAVIAAVVILELLGGVDMVSKNYRLHALFKNVQDLKVGDPVKMAGVPVGRVDAIRITNDMVMVTFKISRDTVVRTDSKATIKFMGLMGQNFVGIDFGTEKGAPIEPEKYLQTSEQADITAILAKLDNAAAGAEKAFSSFSGDKIDNLLAPLTDFLKQNREPLTMTIGNIRTISDNIAQGKGTVGRLIKEDALYVSGMNTLSNFEATAVDVRAAIDDGKAVISHAKLVVTNINLIVTNANQVIAQVNAGQGTIGRLLKEDKLYTETTDAMTNLKEIFEKINRGQGTAGKIINDESLFKNAKLTLQKLDKATEGIEDQGALSVMGMVIGNFF
jgi:phospholipid/cholesterol/gamma-HCH transport system substrate-binding protein